MSKGNRYRFQGTQIAVVTGFAPSINITAITLANPAVVSAASHGFANGDIVRLSGIVGMEDFNERMFVVSAAASGTFALSGIDTTNYPAYESGGLVEKATMSNFCELTGYDESTGTTPETDASTICSEEAEAEFGMPDPGSVTMNYNYAPGSNVQAALNAARRAVEATAIKVVLPRNGGVMVDVGVITQTSSSGAVGGIWTGSATLRRQQPRVDVAI